MWPSPFLRNTASFLLSSNVLGALFGATLTRYQSISAATVPSSSAGWTMDAHLRMASP
jgi:hypothetical protein